MTCATVVCKLRTRERWHFCSGCMAKLPPWAQKRLRAAKTKNARTRAAIAIRREMSKVCDRGRARVVL